MNRIGVLWDMDGVLVDTEDFHIEAWTRACRHFGIPFEDDFFHRTFGMNNRGMMTELLGREPSAGYVDEVGGLKEEYYRDSVRGRLLLLPGVGSLLERFSGEGALQAIASSGPRENIDLIVDELDIGRHFKALVSAARASRKTGSGGVSGGGPPDRRGTGKLSGHRGRGGGRRGGQTGRDGLPGRGNHPSGLGAAKGRPGGPVAGSVGNGFPGRISPRPDG